MSSSKSSRRKGGTSGHEHSEYQESDHEEPEIIDVGGRSSASRPPRRHKGNEEDTGRRASMRTSLRSSRRSLLSEEGDLHHASSSHGSRRPSSTSSLTHEDEIERIREMRARRLRQERGEEGAEEGAASSRRLRRSEGTSGRSLAGPNPSRVRSTPMISRRELEEEGLVRRDRDRRPSRLASDARIGGDGDDNSSVYSRARRERLDRSRPDVGGSLHDDEASTASGYSRARRERFSTSSLHSESDHDVVTRDATRQLSDVEARLAARRSRRNLMEAPETVGTTAQISLDELRSRREERSSGRRFRDLSVGDRSSTSQESGTAASETVLAARERIRERARRGAPIRTKSAEEDLMIMRTATIEPEGTPAREQGEYIESLEERETRRLERQQRQSQTSSSDLEARLKERREARAAEREAREREKMENIGDLHSSRRSAVHQNRQSAEAKLSSDIRLPKSSTRTSVPELEISDDDNDNDAVPGWSVRLCLVSAMDLPLNVVPNTPLCPILKFGLVKLPSKSSAENEEAATAHVINMLGSSSLEAVKTAKVRTTTPKILGKRDNGTVDFHQEYRWDRVKHPMNVGLCVELSARAVRTPKNYMESPPAEFQRQAYAVHDNSTSNPTSQSPPEIPPREPVRGVSRSSSGSDDKSGLRSLWGRNSKKQAELEAAEAAAAVARMLVEQDDGGDRHTSLQREDSATGPLKTSSTPQSDYEVTLRTGKTKPSSGACDMNDDVRLGSLVIPLAKLPLDKATSGKEAARLEQWFQLESVDESIGALNRRKKPRVLLEISFSSPETLDESEDELEEGMEGGDESESSLSASKRSLSLLNASFSRRSSAEARGQLKEQEKPLEETKMEEPILEPGVVDFLAVVGCRDIGKQKKDDGSKGWVNSNPDCIVLEQFPPDNDFHMKSGRNVLLPEMVQWFCFPEGARLWRGTAPPSHSDLNLKRFSAASPPNIASSIAAFDACLNCTSSFSWFVIASNSDEYGSSLVKTYGAVIRFYVPAPTGIDPTQDDFAQAILGNPTKSPAPGSIKRLWVPIGICLTSNLPIVGIMEALLLRLCEELSTMTDSVQPTKLEEIHKAVANMILNFQKPIAGAVNCSVPFLFGDRFLLSLPPPTGLPPLPHGRAVVSVCRLLGAEGLNFLLSAILTECKILIHSQEIADIAMVAEVITALTYPFVWSLPYIPILPLGMLEFVEAPLSYVLGIPSCNLHLIDPRALDDVVVIDLDNGFSSMEQYQGKRQSKANSMKHPTPLPASVASNLSKAVYKLLRAEEEVEEEFGGADLGEQILPRLESESLPEREFRVTVAIEICGLLRGYQDCVGPVFNRDKFLKTAPALFEERREGRGVGAGLGSRIGASNQSKVISARSKRFLSLLVNGQNFQQLVESLESTEASFFHEIMELIDDSSSEGKPHAMALRTSSGDVNGSKAEKNIVHLVKSLQKNEDKIPTYRVEKGGGLDGGDEEDDFFYDDENFDDFEDFNCSGNMHSEDRNAPSFTGSILSPIKVEAAVVEPTESGNQSVSMEYLAKLETNPWQYNPLFKFSVGIDDSEQSIIEINEKVKLRDAIGERRFRAWKHAQDQKPGIEADLAFLPESARTAAKHGSALDLTSLVTSAKNDMSDASSLSSGSSDLRISTLTPEQQRVADAKSRDIIRRCLDKAQTDENAESDPSKIFVENGRDLIAESEKALRNPSAQRFLLKILAQRSRLESQRVRSVRRQSAVANSASRLDPIAFNCLVRLSCAMLDSCMEYKEFELAYRLLTYTAGFIMVQEYGDDDVDGDGHNRIVVTMTSRVGLHPIFADLGVWEKVMSIHLQERKSAKKSEELRLNHDEESADEADDEVEYEAAVATLYEMLGYGIPGEELSRFAMRASEEHGWFCDDRGRQLLMLARRISVRRDQADMGGTADTGDIDMVRKGPDSVQPTRKAADGAVLETEDEFTWKELGWCHPAAPSRALASAPPSLSGVEIDVSVEKYMKRSAVTALASIGSSIVVSGGLDGGVFMAHSIKDGSVSLGDGVEDTTISEVRGVHLDWGSASRGGTGVSSDGEYGVGAVSCLAATYGGGQQVHYISATKDTGGNCDDFDVMDSMEGSRIVAGTTAGDLRVWSVKDVCTAIMMTKKEEPDISNASNRLKFSLRGRALSGHRGGVTCIDVPSQVYRPDSLVTGGADGLIKLWSLRAPNSSRRSTTSTSSMDTETVGSSSVQRGRGGDALNTLNGHTGRILCIKTAWHGDHLLSGGADRTIRVWDLAAGGGKSLHHLFGHFGWVTNVQYWGPNTIVSASTDRSIALWDARVRNSPLFMLRHHHSPISDLLVGSRTEPYMVSAATDGTIATWDFRLLSDTTSDDHHSSNKKDSNKTCRIVRHPSASMRHGESAVGSLQLARGVRDPMNAFLSVGSDAILREWSVGMGDMLEETLTGHCDAITSFQSFAQGLTFANSPPVEPNEVSDAPFNKGTLTSSWDGTIRMRKLVKKTS